ncbi:putative RDD family membrane protein YckC [Labedella gwakjiensis]|uniref:Putative RDD family membrane protein YckC n=1 Tax=Labedella gwakjiensis TaxID=390269 RepID=A0A2P8GXX8_9MICO|nr:RDD family protein [Labedella gwakjiensis]PSL38811.1 putative RDD family membrane protein YckC [Labedella gwakjiensis]RUQ86718.1 RDD family protein [Labedella gwakjiensis]
MTSSAQSTTDPRELVTGEAVALDVRAASFVLRAAGAAIDLVVHVGFALLLGYLLFLAAEFVDIDEAAFQAAVISIIVVSFIVVPTAVELAMRGRSLGKLAIGARVVRLDGGAIGFRHAFIRSLVGFFEIYMTIGGVAALVGLLSDRSQRLGDLLAGTYAQHERVPRVITPVYGVPPELQGWATTADVARLPDRLARRIAQYLQQVARLSPAARERLGRELAAEAAPYVSPLPNVAPDTFLFAVAAMRREREFRKLTLERERLDLLRPTLDGTPHHFPDR